MKPRATFTLSLAATAAVATLTFAPPPAGEPSPPLTPAADRGHLSAHVGVVPFVDLGGSPPALVPTASPLTTHREHALLTAPDAPVSAAANAPDPEDHTHPDEPDTAAHERPAPDTARGEGGEAAPEEATGSATPDSPEQPAPSSQSEPQSEPEPDPPSDQQISRSHWDNLADCESGNWIDGGSSFETGSARWDWAKPGTEVPSWGTTIHHGGLQFLPSTWTAFKSEHHPQYAYDATRAEQIEVGERVQAAQGWGAWPVCSVKVGLR